MLAVMSIIDLFYLHSTQASIMKDSNWHGINLIKAKKLCQVSDYSPSIFFPIPLSACFLHIVKL